MTATFATLRDLIAHGFDTVIDVRSPAEFAEDHIPGAINLPALSDAERAEVGTIYKQVSPFKARKVGAALVARNVANHVEGPLAQHDGGWRPLVYCWRGGQRSGSFTSILQQIGWRADLIEGGYQTFRRLVHASLYDTPLVHRLILLDGNTGSGKTAILAQLAAQGKQVIDLEGMAGHRGSMLGAMAGGQPSQKAFETKLAVVLAHLDTARPVIVEAESNKIGRINLPPAIWNAMIGAPRIMVDVPLPARADYLTQAYADISADPDRLRRRLDSLRQFRGHAVVDHWFGLLAAQDHRALAMALMADHYDPSYEKSRQVGQHRTLGTVQADRLDDTGITSLADQVCTLIAGSPATI